MQAVRRPAECLWTNGLSAPCAVCPPPTPPSARSHTVKGFPLRIVPLE